SRGHGTLTTESESLRPSMPTQREPPLLLYRLSHGADLGAGHAGKAEWPGVMGRKAVPASFLFRAAERPLANCLGVKPCRGLRAFFRCRREGSREWMDAA